MENHITLRNSIFYFASIVGFIGAIITIYVFLIPQENIEVKFDILNSTNVLDIKADVSQLDILFDGRSLKANNENIRIITLKINNSGNENILKNFYDGNDPFGFKITNGDLLRLPELIETSNPYIKANLKMTMDSAKRVLINPIIFESKEFFVLKILVLHTIDKTPQIIPIGKIAGVKKIEVDNSTEVKPNESFLEKVFSGEFFVQLMRVFGYSFIILIIIVIIGGFVSGISNLHEKIKRKKVISRFKLDPKYSYNRIYDSIFDRFVKDDAFILMQMKVNLLNENLLNKNYNKALSAIKNHPNWSNYHSPYYGQTLIYEGKYRNQYLLFQKMINDGLVIKEEQKLKINLSMKNSLEQFLKYLYETKYVKRKMEYQLSDENNSMEVQTSNDTN